MIHIMNNIISCELIKYEDSLFKFQVPISLTLTAVTRKGKGYKSRWWNKTEEKHIPSASGAIPINCTESGSSDVGHI